MDDLFRNAAENYQLKATQDWDKIAPYISGQASAPAAAVKPSNKKNWLIFVVVLLLLPLLMIPFNKEKSIPAVQSPDIETPIRQTIKPAQPSADNISQETSKEPVRQIADNTRETQSEDPELVSSATYSLKPSLPEAEGQKSNTQNVTRSINPTIVQSVTAEDQLLIHLELSSPSLQTIESPERNIDIQTKINTDSHLPANTNFRPTTSIPVKKTPETRGFYLGINAGPQWNQVEGQGYNKTGLNLGLIGGFSINRKMAVESGIFYSRKYYYSDGQYFHMKKKPGAPTMEVISLEGSSNVIEIPLKVKYDIIDKKKGELFVTAGISTYILTKENNQYYALINGSPQNSNVIYTDKKTYLAGGLNLSAGYSIHLKKKTDIRIEPYMQMPFKGTGVGSMRVTTAGLNIGLTRALR
jgi:hypothetical protein